MIATIYCAIIIFIMMIFTDFEVVIFGLDYISTNTNQEGT